jgi:hypothetical protein
MDLNEFKRQVIISIVPESAFEVEHSHDKGEQFLPGSTTFWLHTHGLSKLERPELELRNVPALFVEEAARLLNSWGHYSTGRPIAAGQTLAAAERVAIPVLLRAQSSEQPFWLQHEAECLELVPIRVAFLCRVCNPETRH